MKEFAPETLKAMAEEVQEKKMTLREYLKSQGMENKYAVISTNMKRLELFTASMVGKRGRQHSSNPIDEVLLERLRNLSNKTIKEAAEEVSMTYSQLHTLAKKHDLSFKAGKKGRFASKTTDPKLVEKLRNMSDLTVKEASQKLGMTPVTIYNLAKKEGLTFKKGRACRKI